MKECAKCGACVPVCPLYQATGRESAAARGKLHLLRKLRPEEASAAYAEILSQCLLCGACSAVCPRGLDPAGQIARARGRLSRPAGKHPFLQLLSRKVLTTPFLLRGAGALLPLLNNLPPESGLRLRLGLPAPAGHDSPAPATPLPSPQRGAGRKPPTAPAIACFTGCLARYLEPAILTATGRLLETGNLAALFPEGQTCCGLAGYAAGDTATAKKLARQNIAAFSGTSLPILTTCASCYRHLTSYPGLFDDEPDWQEKARAFAGRVVEFASFFAGQPYLADLLKEKPPAGPRKKVLYHDPCHLRFGPAIIHPPRQLLALLPAVERVELPGGPQCCGHGGLFHLGQPRLSHTILARLLERFAPLAAEIVVSTCTGCLLHWREGLARHHAAAAVKHLSVLLAEALPASKNPARTG